MQILELAAGDGDLARRATARFHGVDDGDAAAFLAAPSTVAVAAVERGEPIGWAWGYRQPRPDGRSYLLLYSIDVAAQHRRRGVGRALLERILDIGRREGHAKVWLATEEDNAAAIALYRDAGGRPSTTRDLHYWWPLDADDPITGSR